MNQRTKNIQIYTQGMRVCAHPSKQYNVIGRRGDAKSEMLKSDECISVLAAINLSFLVFIMYCYLFESYYLPFSLSYLFYFIFFGKSHLPSRCVCEFRVVCFHSHLILDRMYKYFR